VTRVLLVEDEESFSDALSYLLRKEGFEVAVCPTGLDALATFDRSGADLVVLDLLLPGMSGIEVCRALRQRPAVPVIMLTAKDTEAEPSDGRVTAGRLPLRLSGWRACSGRRGGRRRGSR
jgi:two-component system, OmpR family, response regulator RegX3